MQHRRDTRRKPLMQTPFSYSFHANPVNTAMLPNAMDHMWHNASKAMKSVLSKLTQLNPAWFCHVSRVPYSDSIPLGYLPASSWQLHGFHMALHNPCITQLEGNLCYTCCKARGLVLTVFTSLN